MHLAREVYLNKRAFELIDLSSALDTAKGHEAHISPERSDLLPEANLLLLFSHVAL